MSTASTAALVLTGGGTAGGAWMVGLLDALGARGADLGQARLIVGTSAGARTGAQLATGVLADVARRYQRAEFPRIAVPAPPGTIGAAMDLILADAPDRREAARRIANLPPLGPALVPAADRRRELSAQLPVQQWPERRLLLVAVDAESGRRVTFDANSRVALLDAVMASGNVPGVHALVEIDGRRYADGGAYSPYNIDLAAGHEIVVMITPIAIHARRRPELDAQVAALGAAVVHVIAADATSRAAIGSNTAENWPMALAAGAAQAEQEADALAAIWNQT
jgi:NTE family protein